MTLDQNPTGPPGWWRSRLRMWRREAPPSEKLTALIEKRLAADIGDTKSVWSLACRDADIGPVTSASGTSCNGNDTIVSRTLTSSVTLNKSDWSALEAKAYELVDDLWHKRFNLLVEAVRARCLHDLQACAVRYGRAVGIAQVSSKSGLEKVDGTPWNAQALASALARVVAIIGSQGAGLDGRMSMPEYLKGSMLGPVLVSCTTPPLITDLLADHPNAIRRASAPDAASSPESPLARSAALVGSRSHAHAAVWQVNDEAVVEVVEIKGTLKATVTETVSVQAEAGACLLWLPFPS